MEIGTCFCDTDQDAIHVKHQYYRYLNAAHFFTYQGMVKRYRDFTLEGLVENGLLEEDEIDALKNSSAPSLKHTMWLWIGGMTTKLHQAQRIGGAAEQEILEGLARVRGATSSLAKEMKRLPPFSF